MASNNPSNDPNSVFFRSIVKSLEVIIRTQQDPDRKNNHIRILEKLKSLNNPAVVRQLDTQNQRKLMEIRTMIKIYRNAFQTTTKLPQYEQFKIPDNKISDPLLEVQQKIDPKDYRGSYVRALTLKKKQFGWTKQFINDWAKAVEDQKKIQQERVRQKNAQKVSKIKNQPLPQISNPQIDKKNSASSLKVQQKSEGSKTGQKSLQKLPGEKPEKKVKKDDGNGQKPQKQKKAPKPKKQVQQSDSEQNEAAKEAAKKKSEKQQRERLQQRFDKPRQPKNRVNLLMEYLQIRKDFPSLSSGSSKCKEIAEFLNQNLEKFMKHHLFNLIQIAKLRNRKHQTLPSSGNQFTYFSKQGNTLLKSSNNSLVLQQPPRMLKLNYRSKFQLYSMLRSRQETLEQSLLKQFASRRDLQTANKSDKKLWEYLLRPNQVIEKTQNFVEMEEGKTDRLSIEITHIRYLFQSHKFIKNSWLMMYCYNS